ncbi:7393_t:CDS:2, partial [Paraglomus brasilianum]
MNTVKEKVKDMLADQIPSRRSEIPFIQKMRMSFLFVCYVSVAIFFCWKAYKLAQDERTLTYGQDDSIGIPPPTAYFTAFYNFAVDCIQFYDDGTNITCNQYISSTQFDQDASMYYASFNGSDLEFLDPNDDKNVDKNFLDELDMTISITDKTFVANTDAFMFATFLDQETQVDLAKAEAKRPRFKGLSDYESTAYSGNSYYFGKNQSYDFLYERKIFNRLKQNGVNKLSGNGDHRKITLIDSVLVPYPPDDTNYVTLRIRPKSYIVVTETENSDSSVIDFLSAVGGIYATAMGVYAFLYGADAMGPWGFVQNLPCIRRKVKAALRDSLRPNIPFSDSVLSKDLSIDEKFVAMEQRQLALELFLKEYVVSVDNVEEDENAVRAF